MLGAKAALLPVHRATSRSTASPYIANSATTLRTEAALRAAIFLAIDFLTVTDCECEEPANFMRYQVRRF
jgi:hypothetical protein